MPIRPRAEPFSRRWIGGIALPLVLLLSALPAQAAKYALLIGINVYKEQGTPSLIGPVNDVQALREVLMRRWGFPEQNIISLTDQQATRSRILNELQRLETRSQSGDAVLLYFSGHGTSRSNLAASATSRAIPEHTGAWVPHDVRRLTGSPEEKAASLIIGQRDLRPILERLDRGQRRVYLISDSCYSGEVFRNASGGSCGAAASKHLPMPNAAAVNLPAFSESAVDLTYPYRNVVFLSASGPGETAWDLNPRCLTNYPTLDGKAHGALTDALLRALDGKLPAVDRDGDGQISHDELFRSVLEFMAQRRYPHTPQGHPTPKDGSAAQLLPLPIFGEGQAPPAVQTEVAAFRVEVPEILTALRAPLAKLPDIVLAGPPFDLLLQREGSEIRVLSAAGEEVTRVPTQDFPTLAETLRHQARLKRLLAHPPVRKGQRVTLDLEGPHGGGFLREGESYTLTIGIEQPAYLVVLNLFPQGQISILYPYDVAELQRQPAQSVARFPAAADDYLKVAPPCGEDTLVALAFPEAPSAIRPLLGGPVVKPGGALQPHLNALWQEAEQRAAWSFLRVVTQCRPKAEVE